MNKLRRKLNIDYSLIQGSYWMFYEVSAIFVAVYMLDKGYSNTTIGVVIAGGNILSVLCQTVLSNLADKAEAISNIVLLKILTAALFVVTLAVFFIGKNCLLLTLCYTMLIIIHTTIHPFANSFSFDLERCGEKVSFGIGRAMGSLCAGVMSFIIGGLVVAFGVDSIPGSGIIIVILIYFSIVKSERDYNKNLNIYVAKEDGTRGSEPELRQKAESISMLEFAKRNKGFLLIGFGVVALFFGNVILENFVIQIVRNIGGDSTQMSIIAGVGACCEIPAMLCFDKIKTHFTYKTLIIVSTVFFIIKIIMFLMAKNLEVIYLAQLNQILGYGLIFPAMVGFINHIMDEGEAIRGQAVFTAAITIGQVFGMVLGGIILDAFSVNTLLIVSTIISAFGAIVIARALKFCKE